MIICWSLKLVTISIKMTFDFDFSWYSDTAFKLACNLHAVVWFFPAEVCCTDILTYGGTAPADSACIFPFSYKGTTYESCTTVNNDGVLWCYTTEGTGRLWGNCYGIGCLSYLTTIHTLCDHTCLFACPHSREYAIKRYNNI